MTENEAYLLACAKLLKVMVWQIAKTEPLLFTRIINDFEVEFEKVELPSDFLLEKETVNEFLFATAHEELLGVLRDIWKDTH